MESFLLGLEKVIKHFLYHTNSGRRFRTQWQARMIGRAPNTALVMITTTFPPPQEFRDINLDDSSPPPDPAPVPNSYRPFFFDFIARPKCVQFVWRYNLQTVDPSFLLRWNNLHPN